MLSSLLRCCRNVATLSVLISLFALKSVFAATPDINSLTEKPAPIPALPDADAQEARIDSSTSLQYKDLIIPELYPLVRSGLLEFPAAEQIKFAWKLDPDFERRSEYSQIGSIAQGGALNEGIKLSRGLIAGRRAAIDAEKDSKIRAYKILWNLNSLLWSQRTISSDFSLRSIVQGKVNLSLGGTLSRVYPNSIDPGIPGAQLFRERLTFTEPSGIRTLAWLTFRFLGADEDMLWIYSPAIMRERQLTGSNRSDGIMTTVLALDDLFTWSGKIESLDANVIGNITALVPFSSISPAIATAVSLEGQGEGSTPACYQVAPISTNAGKVLPRWNIDSRRFPQAASWLPSASVFIPRDLWRIEIGNKDPYSQYGRQVLYVDKETMTAPYKVVYNRNGDQWKLVISAFGLAKLPESSFALPYNAYTIVEDRISKDAAIFEPTKTTYCDSFTKNMKLSDFDPRKLGPSDESPSSSKTSTSPS